MRCLRINERGDRRYRVTDVQSFLRTAGATREAIEAATHGSSAPRRDGADAVALGALHGWLPVVPDAPVAAETPLATPADPLDSGRLALLAELSRIAATTTERDAVLPAMAGTLRRGCGFDLVAVVEHGPSGTRARVIDASTRRRGSKLQLDERLIEVCLRDGRPIAAPRARSTKGNVRWAGSAPARGPVEVYVPIRTAERAWGVLVVESPPERPLDRQDLDLLQSVGNQLALLIGWRRLRRRLAEQGAQARVLAHVTTEISSRLELPVIMRGLVDHAMRLFGADRAAVYERTPSGSFEASHARNVSESLVAAAQALPRPSAGATAIDTGHAVAITDYANDPASEGIRDAVIAAGFDTIAAAPLIADGEVLGVIVLYHEERHEWAADDLHILEALGAQAGVAIRNARNYQQMASWAAQLQSIQQLGARLARLTTVADIGTTIAAELNQLIDYHNVRVYQIVGDDVMPVAWRGHTGAYTDEDAEGLRMKVGQGITGWVAEHGQAQYLPDAALDPRSETIPGTEDDLAESMLLAPMLFDDRVLGVIVLSKLGLDRFQGADDLRLLEIYASFAAQAMANADATERLRAQSERLARQVASQRELMRATESILSTLDPRTIMENIADRLGNLVKVDNLGIDTYDAEARMLRPIFARGVHAEHFMERTLPDDRGIGGWVARHGEAQLVPDEMADPRVAHFEEDGPGLGALIVTPLRGTDRTIGVLTLERIGPDATFDEDEFELIKLFSGHVSIALQNAMAHQAVELRAQTDALTGLKNHGTFVEYLTRAITRAAPFSLVLLDLDEFKAFNDRRGHEAGSQLLAGIAEALRVSCRESDEIFRYGGDEFAVILPGADAGGALAVAEKLGRAVRVVPIPGGRRRAGVTCSAGVAAFPTDGTDRRSLLLAADRACYLAKRQGRGRAATAAMVAQLPRQEQSAEPLVIGVESELEGLPTA